MQGKHRLTLLICILLLSISWSAQAQNRCFERKNFNENTKQAIYLDMNTFISQNSSYPPHTIRLIVQQLDSLLDILPTEIEAILNCDAGSIIKSEDFPHPDSCTAIFSWPNPNSSIEEYFGYYLNLDEIHPTPIDQVDSKSIPEVRLTVPITGKHLFAVNTRCQSTQSSYSIIIVEKDFGILTGLAANDSNDSPFDIEPQLFFCEEVPNLPETRLAPSTKTTLSILPNLIHHTDAQIHFELTKSLSTTIQVIDGRSGALVKTVLAAQIRDAGKHTELLSTVDLAAGMYYLLLQTDQEQIIQRFVKL